MVDAPSRLAYHDGSFVDSDDARPLRILAEYLEPLHRFREQRIQDTVVFFGSARITPEGPLGRYYDDARDARPAADRVVERAAGRPPLRRLLRRRPRHHGGGEPRRARRRRPDHRPQHRAAARAASRTRTSRPSSAFEFHYFFMRKLWFSHLARALVVVPGRLRHARRAVRDADARPRRASSSATSRSSSTARDYWNEVINFEAMVRHGMIDARGSATLFSFADDPSTALALLQAKLPTRPEPTTPAFAKSRTPPRPRAPARDRRSSSSARRRPSPGRSTSCARRAPRCCSTAACFRAGGASRSRRTATSRSTGGRSTPSCSRTRTSTTRGRCRCCAGTASTGPIYATPATRDLAAPMLLDAAMIQEADARYIARLIERGEPDLEPVEPLYGEADVAKVLAQMVGPALPPPADDRAGRRGDVPRRRPRAGQRHRRARHRGRRPDAAPRLHRRSRAPPPADPARPRGAARRRVPRHREHLRRPPARPDRAAGRGAGRGDPAHLRARRQGRHPVVRARARAGGRLRAQAAPRATGASRRCRSTSTRR